MADPFDRNREPRGPSDMPLHRFNEFVAFTPGETETIRQLGEKPVRLDRASVIRAQGIEPTCLFLLLDGWVASSVDYDDGTRQIVKLHLPGDLLGVPSMSLATTSETLTALTPVVVSRVPLTQFGHLLARSPRFAISMFLGAQRERVALMDTLGRLGRTSAAQRLAALILDLLERLTAAGQVTGTAFALPLTQEHIADALGITPVHVNRTFRDLEGTGLLARSRNRIEVVDPTGLARYARWSPRPLNANLDWVPASDDA